MTDQERYARVRSILLKAWDPLCIGGNFHLADEYDAFLPRLIDLLGSGAGIELVAKYLEGCERILDPTTQPQNATPVASILCRSFS